MVNLAWIGDPGVKLIQMLNVRQLVLEKDVVSVKNAIPYGNLVNKVAMKAPDEVLSFMGEEIFDPGEMVVFEEGDMLRARLPFGIHPGDEFDFDLIPAGPDRFNPGLYQDGKLFNIEMGVNFDFVVEAGTAGSMKMLAANGMVLAEGERAR